MYLFLLAVFGNTFYGLQIFTKSIDAAFVVNSLPWILGSLGILIFDFIVSYLMLQNFVRNGTNLLTCVSFFIDFDPILYVSE